LDSVFSTDLINLNLKAVDKKSAILQMAQTLVDKKRGNDVSQIVKDVLERDQLGTPQVDGIAIPHARSSGVDIASVSVARCKPGVSFDEDDGVADVLLMIVVPDSNGDEHLNILSELARRLMNPDFSRALRETNTAEELFEILNRSKEKI